jgi:tetratricopeptide (TPR) repeat protein
MRASMLLESDPAAAAGMASAILAKAPDNEAANLLFVTACRRLGNSEAALQVIESLAKANPHSAALQLEVGRTYAALEQFPEATAAFLQAVKLDPSLSDAWREVSAQYVREGDTLNTDRAYREYARLARDPPELIDAYVAFGDGRVDAAAAMVQKRLHQVPDDVAALQMMAKLANRRFERIEAEAWLNECLRLAPGNSSAREELARLLNAQERVAEALPLIDRLLALEPENVGYNLLKAQSLRMVGRLQEAMTLTQRLVEREATPDGWLMLGYIHRELGQQSQAIDCYRKALTLQPGFSEAYWALANLKTFRFSDAEVDSMRAELAKFPERIGGVGDPRTIMEFALGKALEDRKNYADSFQHYLRGNARQRAIVDYDAKATDHFVRRSKGVFTLEFFGSRADFGAQVDDPIFVVGMPRSGSTLLEQILASHPQIEGTRELPDIPNIVRALAAQAGADNVEDYHDRVGALSKTQIAALAERYLSRTREHRPLGLPRFVDKMLGNFSHLPLIQLMFPRAVIIDARRHPLACSFSCYKQRFATGMFYSYDQGEVAQYYRSYADIMSHYDAVLPGRVHRVHYEKLVANPEIEVRRLLEHCRLPFDPACLRFYENSRPVQTISSEQVRQPIYADSVEQWRHYEAWLGPMREPLTALLAEYPAS